MIINARIGWVRGAPDHRSPHFSTIVVCWLEQQQQLNEELREINSFIESENHRYGIQQVYLDNASTANSVKRRGDNRTKRATVRTYSFTRLYDGIHADATLKKVWCSKIISALCKATLAHSDDTSQESSHEEEWREAWQTKPQNKKRKQTDQR